MNHKIKKKINKRQVKSLLIMFLMISAIYLVSSTNNKENDFNIGQIENIVSILGISLLNPSITGRVTGFANDPPSFDENHTTNFNLTQDILFEVQINASDPDNDTIIFTDNAGSPEAYWSVFSMDGTGFISFTPTNDDVGTHKVGISIEDGINDPVTKNFYFHVENVNDPPRIVNWTPVTLTPETTENNTIGFSFQYNATDPDLPYGDVLTAEWFVDGVINASNFNETDGSWTFTTGFCEPRYRNITLKVTDVEGESDSVTWNLSIINVNRLPIWNKTIGNITWEEDVNLVNNISLDEYFNDLDYTECGDIIVFSSTGNSKVTINTGSSAPHYVSFYPEADWFGTEEVFITLDDGYTTINSNNFTLNVTDVPDSPIIDSIPPQYAYCYAEFNYWVNATDVDGDSLVYYDDTDLFDITSLETVWINDIVAYTTGLINFTPSISQVGNCLINITASDGIFNTSTTMNLTIMENYPPIIYPIENQTATENQLFTFSVDGYDSLGNYPLEFSTNFTPMAFPSSSNSTSANFSFTPGIPHRGNHSIKVTAYNSRGAPNSTMFWLEVIEVNNPPVLDYIGPRVAKINQTFLLEINATDPDGDNIAFSNNHTDIFEIDPSTGLINFTPNESVEGVYDINISVTDNGMPNLTDYEIVEFTITPNRDPVIDFIPNQNATENELFELQVNATDPDGDPIQFFDNSTIFDININTGLISFTPNKTHVGLHHIEINVSDDEDGMSSAYFWINITEVNNPPYFDPPLENKTATEGISFYYDINASDQENDTLEFSNNNTGLFEIDPNTGVISFTPTNDDVGNHSINISVTDNNSITSSVIVLSILNVNTPPYIVSYSPLNLTPNTAENLSLQFNVTADDDDLIHGDTLNYTWYLDSVFQSSNQSWLYEPGFTSAGFRNVTVVVSDSNEENDSIEWNVSVNNTNRLPTFGLVVHTTKTDFDSGIKNNVDTETQEGDIILEKQNSSDYYQSGTFISPIIDVSAESNMNFTYINWTETKPAGTNITMQTRSSATNSGITNKTWSSAYVEDSLIERPHYQYIQYMANISTSDTSITPEVNNVRVNYIISNFTGNQNTIYVDWIDLDDFFNDEDEDDNITYDVLGNSSIDISIGEETNKVTLTPSSNWVGSETIYFTMNDSYNTTRSNNITLTFVEYEGIDTGDTIIYSSGGGSTRTVIKKVEEEVEKPYSFNIITPQTMTMYKNDTAIAPINLNNDGEQDLKEVKLSASINNSEVKLSFTNDYFSEIKKNTYTTTNLLIEAYDAVGSYEIVVYANVKEPEFNDSAKFMMSSIELGQWSPEEFETKISFTRDLLENNPECLELNEQLTEARRLIATGEYSKGQLLIQSVVDACKYLITAKEPVIDEPSKEIEQSQRIRIIAGIAGFLFIILLIFYVFSKGNSPKRKKRR